MQVHPVVISAYDIRLRINSILTTAARSMFQVISDSRLRSFTKFAAVPERRGAGTFICKGSRVYEKNLSMNLQC